MALAASHSNAAQITVNGPSGSGQFGVQVAVLPNGNVVVADPYWDDTANNRTDVGAVYLYSSSGSLISTLRGSSNNDRVGLGRGAQGGITVLASGNFLVHSINWGFDSINGAKGAVTFGSATLGTLGSTISSSNSLVGSAFGDVLGSEGIVALPSGHYLVASRRWNGNMGAVTWGSGTSGRVGFVSAANSLVGSVANQFVGTEVELLPSGNYVVISPNWSGTSAQHGAATFGVGSTGTFGVVSISNSRVGSALGDFAQMTVTPLGGDQYALDLPYLDTSAGTNVGAAVLINDAAERVGTISDANAFLGTSPNDMVGRVTALGNGNCVISAPDWANGPKDNVGAVTFVPGCSGNGLITASNALIGEAANDFLGSAFGAAASLDRNIKVLNNGDYIVISPSWSRGTVLDAGAVTIVSGTSGLIGTVTPANSLVGAAANDRIGTSVSVLNGSHVVVASPLFDTTVSDAGAVTWLQGSPGSGAEVSSANSLLGANAGDQIGDGGVAVLANGNYVVMSNSWNSNRGAFTFGSGTSGVQGAVSAANSWVGSTAQVGVSVPFLQVLPLANGNFLMSNFRYNNTAGIVAFANGTSGKTGTWGAGSNVLIGNSSGDRFGVYLRELSNGNFVLPIPEYSGLASQAGAVLYGNMNTGLPPAIGPGNSLLGAHVSDELGEVHPQANGNYVVRAKLYDSVGGTANVGLVTIGSGNGQTVGTPNASNAVFGTDVDSGSTMQFAYDNDRNQVVVGIPASNRVVIFAPGETSTTTISAPITQAYVGQPNSFSALVTAASEPIDGRVTLRSSTGDSCVSDTPVTFTSDTARFTCTLTFTSAGNKSVTAEYAGSFRTAYSKSAPVTVSVSSTELFSNSFE